MKPLHYIYTHNNEYIGKRVKCIHMYDPYPVEPNTMGTIVHIDSLGYIHVDWDNGRTLSLIPDEDNFEIFDSD